MAVDQFVSVVIVPRPFAHDALVEMVCHRRADAQASTTVSNLIALRRSADDTSGQGACELGERRDTVGSRALAPLILGSIANRGG